LDCLAAATSTTGLYALSLADLHGGLVVDGGVAHALLDLACHGKESLLDVAGILGGGLEEWDAEAVCELLLCASVTFLALVFLDNHVHDRIPLRQCTPQPSCLSYRSCCRLAVCSHPPWHSDRSLAATA
jgi:hypothetical protein